MKELRVTLRRLTGGPGLGKKKLKRVEEGFDQVKRKGWFWKVWVRRSKSVDQEGEW